MSPARFSLTILLCLTLLASSGVSRSEETALDETNSWDFAPARDPFTPEALLDLRSLNETHSGETGFVKLSGDGNSFVRGDGQPIRFWAIGTDAIGFSPEDMDFHARWLAKLGVNLVRLHVTICDTKEGSQITDLNEEVVGGVHRFIKSCKDNGIYVLISPFYPHFDAPTSWGLAGDPKGALEGIIFFDPKLQDAYRHWTREFYTRKNPYTGLAIAEDPTVAILQVLNEDSLLFWTQQNLPEAQRVLLADQFSIWLSEKYGSVPKAWEAWGEGFKGKDPVDHLEAGRLAVLKVFELTRDPNPKTPALDARLRDTTEYIGHLQRDFYAAMGRHLREDLGCRQLLNATNWRTANDGKLKAVERWSYHALEIDAENEYVGSDYQHKGEADGYRIDAGHFLVNESVLGKPFELSTNFRLEEGHPFIVTETSWKNPNRYQSEGAFLGAAYQSLTGLDGICWFSAQTPYYENDPRKPFWNFNGSQSLHKWNFCWPMSVGMFPANALMYRQGYVAEGEPVVHEERSLDQLWNRESLRLPDNELYGDARHQDFLEKNWKPKGDAINPAAFLIGPVTSKLDRDPTATITQDLSQYLDLDLGIISSNTGELNWHYRDRLVTLNSLKAKGVSGFLKKNGGEFVLGAVTIRSTNDYATIQLVSMDGAPIKSSKRVLIQCGTAARLTGWRTEDAVETFGKGDDAYEVHGERILTIGGPPWRVENTYANIKIANPRLTKATLLDVNGYPVREIVTTRNAEVLEIPLPRNAMYVIVETEAHD
ncbi:MAG: hypothetical protein KDN20_06890 [Verrucomicrobiae bacterium]|nr:hypothetical protein [Verrucomicrobiae bacterium]